MARRSAASGVHQAVAAAAKPRSRTSDTVIALRRLARQNRVAQKGFALLAVSGSLRQIGGWMSSPSFDAGVIPLTVLRLVQKGGTWVTSDRGPEP